MKNVKNNKKIIKKPSVKKSNKIHVHNKFYYIAKRITLCLIAFLAILALGVLLSMNVLFKISKIEISGESVYSYDEIVGASGIKEGDNLFSFDTLEGKKNIESKLPYVDNVEISKKLPNKIDINVKVAEPKFALKYDEKYIIISESGKIYDFLDELPDKAVEIQGAGLVSYELCQKMEYADSAIGEKIREIMKNADKNEFNVTKIDASNLYNICIKYDDRVDIILGYPDEIEYKILTAKEILQNKLRNDERGKLDLSSLKLDGKSYFTPEYITK